MLLRLGEKTYTRDLQWNLTTEKGQQKEPRQRHKRSVDGARMV